MADADPGGRVRLAPTLALEGPRGVLAGRALGTRKARTLLALVAAERGRPVSLDRVVAALWPAQPPRDPAANVATLVSRLRSRLGAAVVVGAPGGYRLAPQWRLDLDDAEQHLAEAEVRTRAGDVGLAAGAARTALALVDGSPLADEDDAAWVEVVREEAAEKRRRARHLLAAAALRADPGAAATAAQDAVAVDPYDEQGARLLMRALAASGRTGTALTVYGDLVARLRDDLGTDPEQESRDLHLALLRDQDVPEPPRVPEPRAPEPPAAGAPTGHPALVGREPELATAAAAWQASLAGRASLLLVEGPAGIGKTRLLEGVAELAAATGGRVLTGRCHPSERSLFLQPWVDAIRPALVELPGAAAAALVGPHVAAWCSLVPELVGVLPSSPVLAGDVALQRRQVFEAVAEVLHRLSLERPLLLLLDDLHDGGAATVDLLGHLAGRLSADRVLLVGATRPEATQVGRRLAARATEVPVGALPPEAVAALAAAAGLPDVAAQVMSRTAGHALSVVEYLRSLAVGARGVPESLSDAVLTRVERLHPSTRAVVEAGSVLRRRLDPRLLAALTATTEVAAVQRCEEAVRVGLLVRSGDHYEFANDLLQECVHAGLAPALAAAWHRQAADLVSGSPETMAEHAHAAGDHERAAHGWLLAGQAALRRAAVDEAAELLDRSLAVTTLAPEVRARALLARSAVHEARTAYDAGLADVDAALALARESGEARLEMAALRVRGGDAATGSGVPHELVRAPLEAGLRIAEQLGDRASEADFTTRLVVLDASDLRLTTALARAERAVARARSAGSDDALLSALDGLKTAWSYLADPEPLQAVVDELEPRARRLGETWLLQWVVFESSLAAAGRGRWSDARALVAEALDLNRRSGYPAYARYLLAHDGWFARLQGDLDEACRLGREALAAVPVQHPWWHVIPHGLLGAALLEAGDRGAAAGLARHGLEVAPHAAAGGRLRCLAVLAAATGDPDVLAEATGQLDEVECPPGHAWIVGADCYLLLATAARDRGDEAEAERLLTPLRDATRTAWAELRRRADAVLPQSRSATSAAARDAPSPGTGT